MPSGLPETIRVKLSTEEAGAISVTPVVVREMPLRELVALMLDLTGKDAGRIRELLLRGTLVSGASRYRWTGWESGIESLTELLSTLPDPDPDRAFVPEQCLHAVIQGQGLRVDLPRSALLRKRWLRKRSFWDALMEAAAEQGLEYVGYSYRKNADRYRLKIAGDTAARIGESASLVCYSNVEHYIRGGRVESVEFFVARVPG